MSTSPFSEFKFIRRGSLYRSTPLPTEKLILASTFLFSIQILALLVITDKGGIDWRFWTIVGISFIAPTWVWLRTHPRLEIKISSGVCALKWLSGKEKGKSIWLPLSDYSAIEVRPFYWQTSRNTSEDLWLCILKHQTESDKDFIFYQLAKLEEANDLAYIVSHFLGKPVIK